MIIDGIEVLAQQMPVPPEGGLVPIYFPIHKVGNRVDLHGPSGDVLDTEYVPWLEND
jgi:hypothetical protein